MNTPLRRYSPFLATAFLVAGCANFASLSTGTPAQEVQAKVGTPSTVWKNPDGTETWEYPLGPLGVQTYMVSFGPDRAVRDVQQVLTDENISKLRPGMSRDEVRRAIGRPAGVSFSGRTDEEIWYWRYLAWDVRKMEAYAQFDQRTGMLKQVQRHQIDTSDSRRN